MVTSVLKTGAKLVGSAIAGGGKKKKQRKQQLAAPVNIDVPEIADLDPVQPDFLSRISAPGFTGSITGSGGRFVDRQVKTASPVALSPVNQFFPGGVINGPFGPIPLPGFNQGLFGPRETTKTVREFEPGNRAFDFRRSAAVTDLVNLRGRRSQDILSGLRDIEAQVEPGFGNLTKATRGVFAQARERLLNDRNVSIGNAREALSRRRVLGSSFASDAIGRREREFEDQEQQLDTQEAQALATAALQELDVKRDVILARDQVSRQAIQDILSQFNFESGLAAELASEANRVFADAANLEADIAARKAFLAATLTGDANRTAALLQSEGLRAVTALDAQAQAGTGRFIGGVVDDIFDSGFVDNLLDSRSPLERQASLDVRANTSGIF